MLNLYETYYKLSADPFRLSPDHHFAYGHQGYANAKAYLEYAFFQGEGFVMVTGEPGTGKTTLINEIIAGLDQAQMKVATLTTTQLDTRDLLHMVAVLFGMRVTEVSKPALLMDLKRYLSEQADRGWRSVLVVDEAQGLSSSGLEELRLLANLQHHDRLLIQICLIGQEQLRDLVQEPQMEHLRQRIIAASHLQPLSFAETVDYIEHRLQHAGWKGDPGISAGALRRIHRHSGGIPRLINLICNRLFLYGGLESKHQFVEADAEQVIGELRIEQLLRDQDEAVADKPVDISGDFSLPRAGSEPPARTSAQAKHAAETADIRPRMTPVSDNEKTAATPAETDVAHNAVPAELGEPYIASARTSEPLAVNPLEDPYDEFAAQSVNRSRRIMAVLVLLVGLVLVVMFGTQGTGPQADRLKALWLDWRAVPESSGTVSERPQVRQQEPITGETLKSEPAGVDAEPEAPTDSATPLAGAVAVTDRPTRDTENAALPLVEVEAADAGQPRVQVPAPVVEAPADGLQKRIAEERSRLEQRARSSFERRFADQYPDKMPPVPVAVPDGQGMPASAVKKADAASISSLETTAVAMQAAENDAREDLFASLKDLHVALLDGRWSASGRPAVFLPSEITFCGQGRIHAQISCWSVPQYVEADRKVILQKVEATLQGFSSSGEFELVYRAMRAPADSDDDRLLWQTTEHHLWCEFSSQNKVLCADPDSEDVVELERSPLSHKNSVGIIQRSQTSG